MADWIGRRLSVGLGVESTAGTSVAPTYWPRHAKLTFQPKTKVVENVSAMGRNEKVNDTAITEQWAEGDLEGKVYDQSVGPLLYNIFGSVADTDNADSNAAVVDHTFSIGTSNTAKTLTVVRSDPINNRRHAMATLQNAEFSCKQGDWVMFKGALHALKGTTGTDTTAYIAENPFTSKHITVKLASLVAGLSGASAISVKSFRLTISRELNKYFALGAVDPAAINVGAVTVEGEMVLKYSAATYETLFLANTAQAMSIAIVNTDVTIGSAANPGLTFTMPKVRLREFNQSDDLDNVIESTVGFTAEFDTTTSYMLRALLTNTVSSY